MMPPRPTLMKTGLCNSNNKFQIFINKRHTYIPSFSEKKKWICSHQIEQQLNLHGNTYSILLFNDGLLEILNQKTQMKRKRRLLNQWQSLMPLFVMTLLPWICRMIERLPTVSPGSLSYWGERCKYSHTPPGTRSGYRPFCVRYFQ